MRKVILAMIICCLGFAAYGDTQFTARVDKTSVALDDVVSYTLTVAGSGANNAPSPALPSFSNLQIISTSQSSNISIVNGQMSAEKSYTYTLQPTQVGQAHIGAANINVNGQTLTSNPIDITVTEATGNKPQQQAQQRQSFPLLRDDDFFNFAPPHFRQSQPVKDPVKVLSKVNRRSAYVNQLVLLTFSFYRRVNLFQQPSFAPPNTTGFWSIQLPVSQRLREVELDGYRYLAQDFRTALFPTSPGKYTIGSASLTAQTDPFSNPQTFKTNPIEITVLPLPEDGKPEDFAGLVGRYKMQVWAKETTIERGKPLQLTAKVWGEGNIQTISEPQCKVPKEFRKISAAAEEKLDKNSTNISGSKSFEIVLIPLKEGSFTLPPFTFSYFDPSQNKYVRLTSQATPIQVTPSSVPLPNEYTENLDDDKAQGTVDINIPWNKIGGFIIIIIASIYLWIGLIVVALVGLGVWAVKRYQTASAIDPARRALKVAKKKLRRSYNLINANKLKEFIGEIFTATTKYLGDKYHFSSAGVTADSLREILSKKGISEEIQKQVEDFNDECDLIRFTPSSLTKGKATELAKIAEDLIVLIEKQ
ncbi:hypothetical protein A3H38_04875 [candidate division WOR-1 bacterium RIFCSPLOWO2_02_FULL_46_20]|uniref:Protein BatD n=2 Tax=Saganbacteria TaxID=1703751 RepID=A0A1F4R437_UNCSA|nr:MAG: hypothetical protein A3J44_05870 [candidate division WOR-1 bacterium RIFCSPHIGHO2_02_FULL_45_12]OGC02922.1 MAG: hypothetical protein A3H38_04875 [candidate division WOR-1 bacterium RIFCSPLOWO2_02_FULL_46_20]OGC08551.1 MAG: hypothetical protein A3F86_04835 [candidate division WOR-1 bacterium RIFCSPLOWO2_12_FULL_45_9]